MRFFLWLYALSSQGFLVVAAGSRPSTREKSWLLMRDAEVTPYVQLLSSRFMAFLGGILDEIRLTGFLHMRILKASLIKIQYRKYLIPNPRSSFEFDKCELGFETLTTNLQLIVFLAKCFSAKYICYLEFWDLEFCGSAALGHTFTTNIGVDNVPK